MEYDRGGLFKTRNNEYYYSITNINYMFSIFIDGLLNGDGLLMAEPLIPQRAFPYMLFYQP